MWGFPSNSLYWRFFGQRHSSSLAIHFKDLEQLFPADPLGHINSKHLLYQIFTLLGKSIQNKRKSWLPFPQNLGKQPLHSSLLEGTETKEKFIKDDSNRSDICSGVILHTTKNFRSHIDWGTNNCMSCEFFKEFTKAKIGYFYFLIMEEYILQF